ncbi:MAG: 3-deoxy-D-manno-octulosonic acid kinase [Gammaproteobacteria bacterium]|nr:3-deoxy-D-manno-octulosonic acid kinase [Gammaproteobacteria bacterium]MDH3767699.1 3-deoxy-D-manno-octulosonic acid kinase [Gammaproteobacteria bacterium]
MDGEIIQKKPDRYDGRIIIDARVAHFDEQMFTPEYWRERNCVSGTAGGRGQVLFVDNGHEQWVLRHYHRGGAMTLPLKDRYFWAGAERTRSMMEWRLLAELYAQGLPVPQPVAARYVRDGVFYRADLLTKRIPGTRALSEIAAERLPGVDEWRAIGACIRRLHDEGVYHADLNAHNILLGDQYDQIYVVDFDRGRRRPGSRWKIRNLRRLNRSLHKIGVSLSTPEFEEIQWPSLLQGYGSQA